MNIKRLLYSLACSCLALGNAAAAPAFIQNIGQITDQQLRQRTDIDYRISSGGVSLFIGSGQLHYQWVKTADSSQKPIGALLSVLNPQYLFYRMDVQLLGANTQVKPERLGEQEYSERYYTNGLNGTVVHSCQKIIYRNIYPHIDWVLYERQDNVEYDFVVHDGGNVSDIRLQYSGNNAFSVNRDGSITATTPFGTVTEAAPVSHQADGKSVVVRFSIADNIVTFHAASYAGALVIDPTLIWGTYFGGSLNEQVNQTSCDKQGNVYIAGSTASTANIATSGAFQTSYGGGTGGSNYVGDAFLAKFSSNGQCLWATYYGGTGADQGYGLSLDTAGRVYLAGFTNSISGIASAGSYQATLGGGYDAFIAQFDTAGVRNWATYYGGTGNENSSVVSVSCDSLGNVYCSGGTNSATGIATAGSQQATLGGGADAFLVKWNSAGQRIWATYLGGTGTETGYQLVCANNKTLYLTGMTASTTGIATAGSFQPTYGGGQYDSYLVRYDSAGNKAWGTYYGGAVYDRGISVIADDSGYVYFGGLSTSTTGIATTGAHQTVQNGSNDAFIAKFTATGQRLWASYYGGSGSDLLGYNAFGFDLTGNLYVSGRTASATDMATAGSYQSVFGGGSDGFLVKFTPAGTRLWGSYLGGTDVDYAYSLTTDHLGSVFLCGETSSANAIATSNGYQSSSNGGYRDGFLVKLNDCDTPAMPGVIAGPTIVCHNSIYTYTIPVMTGASAYNWILPTGWTGSSTTTSITVTAGTDSGTIKVYAVYPCINSPMQTLHIEPGVKAKISFPGSIVLCFGDSIPLHAVTGIGYNYHWLKNDTLITGVTDSVLTVYTAGKYKVISSHNGCTDTSAADTIGYRLQLLPLITNNSGLLSTGSYGSYQWLFNGVIITGATTQSYTATLGGLYSVKVTDTNGCTGVSNGINFYAAGTPTLTKVITPVAIYPNPAINRIYIQAQVSIKTIITDITGRVVLPATIHQEIDIRMLANGIYLCHCYNEQGMQVKTEKLIINR